MPKTKSVKKVGKKVGARVEKPKFKYHLELEINDQVFKFDTNNLHQTLKDFNESPEFPFPFKTKLVVRYSNDKLKREKIFFNTIDSKRLFENKTSLELLANQLTKELDA
jgi:hypothetical protein